MLGSELLLKCLEKQKVEMIFGIPGGVLLPLYHVLPKSKIKHILTRHEQGAAHAADGYARSTGKVGVCFSTSGPGAANLTTGLLTAYMDSSPVVAITGQVVKGLLGKDSFQEADTVGISQPVTKHNYLVKDANDLPDIIEEAFYIATHGRPGPVLIDIPKDVFTQEVKEDCKKPKIRDHVIKKLSKPLINIKQVEKAFELLKNAKKPLILAGGGVNLSEGANKLLTRIAQRNEIPVAVTLMGKGVFPPDNHLYLGMVGMHGTTEANWAIQNCDCLLALGIRFDDRVTGKLEKFASQAKIIHVDIDATEIGKIKKADVPILGDSKEFLELLNQKLWASKNNKDWIKQIQLKRCFTNRLSTNLLHPKDVLESVNQYIDENTVIVTDVGQHQMWAALYLHPQTTRSFITSGGLGTMGFGLPAAIGVQMANPHKKVILITGDGSLQMNLQELVLLKQWNLPVKILLVNNGYLGMVRQWQELFFEENYSESQLVNPDWEKLFAAYGIDTINIENFHEQDKQIEKALKSDKPCLVNIEVDPGANVFPMVPAGCSLDEIWGRCNNEAHVSSLG